MNKKIKLLISFIFIILILMFVNKAKAFTAYHLYPIATDYYTYYCKQKNGSLKLFTEGEKQLINGEYSFHFYNADPSNSSLNNEQVDDAMATVEEKMLDSMNKYTIAVYSNDGWSGGFSKSKYSGKNYSKIETKSEGGDWNYSFNKESGKLSDGVIFKTQTMVMYESDPIGGVATYNENVNSTKDSNSNGNLRVAYILSSGKNIPKNNIEDGTYLDGKGSNYDTSVSDMVSLLPKENESGHTDDDHMHEHDESLTYEDAIQHALWKDPDYNEKDLAYYNDMGLYNEAVEFENFYNNNLRNGYSASFNDIRNVKTIVNREQGTYTVGPFTIIYPNNDKFSYIKNMYIYNQNGNESSDYTIIKSSSDDPYPHSGESFFVEFKYDAFGQDYPTAIGIKATFSYLAVVESEYKRLEGTGKYYQNLGYIDFQVTQQMIDTTGLSDDNTDKNMSVGDEYGTPSTSDEKSSGDGYGSGTGYTLIEEHDNPDNSEEITGYHYEKIEIVSKRTTSNKVGTGRFEGVGKNRKEITTTETTYYWKEETHYYQAKFRYSVKIIYYAERVGKGTKLLQDSDGDGKWNIISTDKPIQTYDAQVCAQYIDSNREWKEVEARTNILVPLTTKVEGRVWVDNAATKESKVNGLYGAEDTPMPNVEVVLYRYGDNAIMGTTYTDANGHYEFNNLSALSQYYVRFKYNAQYYEPTYYTSPTDYSNGWENTSNGTDYQNGADGRLTFNAKFATINSSTANYYGAAGYNETFTKKELLGYTLNNNGEYVKTRQAVIDDFGRLILESSSDATTQKMIQYVKDSTMYSWTKSPSDNIDPYPYSNIIVINYGYDRYNNLANITVQRSSGDAYSWSGVNSIINIAQNDKSQHINQGYKVRQESDIALKNDVDHVTLEINGKTQEYRYDTRENASNADGTWEIGVRLSDAYYSTNYSREVYPSDYQYRITSYGSQPELYGKTKDDELKIYVTYKLTVRNQSMSIRTRIDEIVDYFDSDYEYVPDRSYIQITRGANNGRYDVKASTTSRYDSLPETKTTINEYQNLYIRGLDGIYLDAGQTAYVYLTFGVEKDSNDYIKLDEVARTGEAIGVGKENIAEINGYSTLYKEGTEIPNVGLAGANKQAGIIDVDSNPGNLKASYVPKDGTIQYNRFEDDTDKAPNIRIILDRDEGSNARTTSGYIWEDNRNQIIDTQATATGNGIREDGETLINGVTVQLVEVMDNGTEYVWREFGSNITGPASIGQGTGSGNTDIEIPIINIENIVKNYNVNKETGKYAFKSFVPGNYVVRFIYGDTVKTVLPNSSEVTSLLGQNGLNAKSYNGQDYKSTIYQTGLGTYNSKNTYKEYGYDITQGDTALVSDAKDIYTDTNTNVTNGRPNATLNSRADSIVYSNKEIRNSFAEELASYMSVPEYNGTKYDKAKMQSMLDSFINGSKMTAETGVIDIEIEYNRTNTENQTVNNVNPYHLANLDLGLEERPKAQIEINKDVKNLKITLANGNILFDASQGVDNLAWINNPTYYSYENNLMTPSKYSTIENIRNSRSFGLVQPTIDKELMHGATVRITYEITAINTGEADYKEEQFYYTGIVGNTNNIVTTTAIQLVDYVPNNLQYYERDNSEYWQVVKTDNLIAGTNNLVNSSLKDNLNKFNTIITTTKTNTALVPAIYTQKVNTTKTDRVSVPLVLTQLITSENKDDDLDYINKVEMVAESNIVGRKMAYSVVGNQDPTRSIAELDADMAEVRVLPPFGANIRYIMIALITIAGASIIIAGIIFIKKKVLVK